MKNLLILIRGVENENRAAFTGRMLGNTADLFSAYEPECLKCAVTEEPPPRLSVIPFRKDLVCLVTFSGKKEPPAEILSGIPGFFGAYEADMTLPLAYEISWCEGEGTPGCGLLTLFRKRPDLDYDAFISRWHDGHTPLSLRIHPLWNYVRNVVTSAYVKGSTWYDGIVEEHFRCGEDLLKPVRFFGGLFPMPVNMFKVLKDVRSFIDYKSIETYFIKEYHVKIGAPVKAY